MMMKEGENMYSKNDVVFDRHKMIERSRTSTDACREMHAGRLV